MSSLLKFGMHLPMMRECIAPLPRGQAETLAQLRPQNRRLQFAPIYLLRFVHSFPGVAMISRAMKISLSTLLPLPLAFLLARPAEAQQSQLNDKIDSNIQDWLGTYKHLHENPELSTQEKETSARSLPNSRSSATKSPITSANTKPPMLKPMASSAS
jgi:hypothetical protein